MKKLTSLIAGLLAMGGIAKADIEKANRITPEDSQKIAEALETLKESQVMTKDLNGKYDLDKDVIQKLKLEGYIKNKKSQVQTICGGHTK